MSIVLVNFKYFLEAFRDSFKVSRFLVFRFLETQKPPKTAGNRKLNVQFADVNVSLYHSRVGSLAGLCEELEAIAGRNMLEALFLEVPINTICHTVDSIESSIQKVENVLAKPGWSALRQVSFKLTISCAELRDHEEFTEALQSLPDKYLNHLPKNEYVAFNYSVS